jgi:cytochrome P450
MPPMVAAAACTACQEIKKGQWLGIFYSSANFDEGAFENPFTFDVLRETPIRTSASAAPEHTIASAPTWPDWKST